MDKHKERSIGEMLGEAIVLDMQQNYRNGYADAQRDHADLLAALKALMEDYELLLGDGVTETNQPLWLKNAKAAVAKAEQR